MHEPEINKMKGPPAVTFSLPERVVLHAASGDVLISPPDGFCRAFEKGRKAEIRAVCGFRSNSESPVLPMSVTLLKNVSIHPAQLAWDESSGQFALYR